jgi:hypothetical protein
MKVLVKEENLFKVKAALDMQFYGTLEHNVSVQGENGGYLVFFKGKDRWELRLSDGKKREAVYLSRQDILEIKYYIEGGCHAESPDCAREVFSQAVSPKAW